ncbi:MAG: NADPH-dependent FMN reductase [Flavobacteriales bacterium]
MKKITFISTSLSKESKSAQLIESAISLIDTNSFEINHIDLRDIEIPFCDGRDLSDYPKHIYELYSQIGDTDYLVFGFPIYCYSISGVFKNFLDIFTKAMENKKYGVCCSLGSNRSFLAIADLQKILTFQCNAKMSSPTVVADWSLFSEGKLTQDCNNKIELMLESLLSASKNS